MGVERVAAAVPVYRVQQKRQQRQYIKQNQAKISHIELQTEAQEQLEFDAIVDTINMIVCVGAGVTIVGALLGLLIHHLGGWGWLPLPL